MERVQDGCRLWGSRMGMKRGDSVASELYKEGLKGMSKLIFSTVLQYDLMIPPGYTKEPPLFVHSYVSADRVQETIADMSRNLLKHLGGTGISRGQLFTHVVSCSDLGRDGLG